MNLFNHQQLALNRGREIVGFPGYYVTREGDVYSNRKRIPNQPQGLIKLKLTKNMEGYCVVSLHCFEKIKQGKVHRLVAEAFLPNRPEGACLVRHIDGNPANNNVTNLRWGTEQENSRDMIRHGRSTKGIKNAAAKLTPVIVKQIRELFKAGRTLQSLANQYGVSKGHVSNVCTRRVWQHV